MGVEPADIERFERADSSRNGADRLNAILRHTDLLTQAPRDGSPASLEALRKAGFSAQDIVTNSQVIAFVSYQIRMVALLRAMGEEP
jgi:uncharacterized protein YciW